MTVANNYRTKQSRWNECPGLEIKIEVSLSSRDHDDTLLKAIQEELSDSSEFCLAESLPSISKVETIQHRYALINGDGVTLFSIVERLYDAAILVKTKESVAVPKDSHLRCCNELEFLYGYGVLTPETKKEIIEERCLNLGVNSADIVHKKTVHKTKHKTRFQNRLNKRTYTIAVVNTVDMESQNLKSRLTIEYVGTELPVPVGGGAEVDDTVVLSVQDDIQRLYNKVKK